MRQFSNPSKPPNYPQFLLNQRAVYNHNISPPNSNENPNIKSDFGDPNNFSNASMESEIKRIESYLQTDTKTYFQNLGLTFSHPDKMRDSVEFNTASFNSKDDMKQSTVIRIPPTNMPALYEVSNENEHFEDEADDISLHNSVASSEYYNGADDNTIIQRALERINRRSAPFYKEIRDKIDKQQQYVQGINDQRLPSSPQSQHMDDGIEIENTFGVKKFSQMVSRINYENKTPSKMTPLFSVSESIKADYSDMEESTMVPSPSNSKIMEASPKAFIKSVKERMKPSLPSIPRELDAPDIDHYLKHLMVPRRMKISIGGVPFQEVIFVLALKFFEKSPYFENFVFEWLDVETTGMIGYIKCDFIKYVYKQGQKRFNIACKDPRSEYTDEETLHYVHVEATTPSQCELYVNGLNEVMKYMEKSVKSPSNNGS